MRKGKYIKIWVYEENLPLLERMDNVGKTINNYIALNNPTNNYVNGLTSTVYRSTTSGTNVQTVNLGTEAKLTCDNGHLLVNGSRCISKACKFNKSDELNISTSAVDNSYCLHKNCMGCKTGSCSGIHMMVCHCRDCSVVL